LSGVVYNIELEKEDNAVVTVNSVPEQKKVGGEYSFELNPGDYTIKAIYFDEGEFKYSTEEDIIVREEGNYNLDLFLFIDLEDDLEIEESIEEIGEEFEENSKVEYAYILLFVVVLILILILRMRMPKKEDDELESVISLIKKEGGRINQKDLRAKLGLSEAKVSLMITELESKEKVERIKKGRGNVIVLKK